MCGAERQKIANFFSQKESNFHMQNNNEQLIGDLQNIIKFLEETPDLPACTAQISPKSWFLTKEAFLEFIQPLGSFTKSWTDDYLSIRKTFGASYFYCSINRETICKKVVTWECPDEGLLQMADELTKSSD